MYTQQPAGYDMWMHLNIWYIDSMSHFMTRLIITITTSHWMEWCNKCLDKSNKMTRGHSGVNPQTEKISNHIAALRTVAVR